MYPWLVTLHLIGLALFLVAHGVSMFVAYRVRKERDRAVITTLLGLSLRGTQAMYVGLLLLGIGGLWAAATAGWLTATWVVASYVVLAIALVAMWVVASPYYMGIRQGLEGSDKTPRLSDEELVARLQSRRPDVLAASGAIAFLVPGPWRAGAGRLAMRIIQRPEPCPTAGSTAWRVIQRPEPLAPMAEPPGE